MGASDNGPFARSSDCVPELLESPLQMLRIRVSPRVLWGSQQSSVECLQALQQGAVPALCHPWGDMHLEIWIDANEVCIKSRVMERGHADSVGHRSGSPFGIGQNMGADQKVSQGESAEGASIPVRRLGSTTEPRLVVTLTDAAKRVAGFCRKVRIVQGYRPDRAYAAVRNVWGGEKNLLLLRAEVLNPHGPNCFIDRGGGGAKVNERRLSFEGFIQMSVRDLTYPAPCQVIGHEAGRRVGLGLLVSIPRLSSGSGHHRLDAESSAHLPRLEDPDGLACKVNGFPLELEATGDLAPRDPPTPSDTQPLKR